MKLLGNLIPDNEAFVRMVLAKSKPRKINRKAKPYIDKWLIANYERICQFLDEYSWITMKGESSLDRLNNHIEGLYLNQDLSFRSQKEADEFLRKELFWKRFVIRLRIN